MSRRYFVLGLAVVLALALAVPAFGGPTNPLSNLAASSKTVAAKALKTAKAAKKSAAAASSAANSAQTSANEAGTAAKGAQTTANEAKKKAETAQTAAGGAQSTANTALSTANAAKTAAAAAQSTANQALTSANSSLKATEFESSPPSPETGTNTTTPKLVAVECAAGQAVTGGGYSIGGSEQNKVTVILQGSAFYGPGWLVDAQAISGTTPSWSLTATAVCAHP